MCSLNESHAARRRFRIFDSDGNKQLGLSELQDGLTHYGLHLEKKDIVTLMAALDRDGAASSLSFDEFMIGIRGVLNERRTKLVDMAFKVLDRDGSGVVNMEDMKAIYNTSHHPEVVDGQMGEDEALHHMLDQFDGGEHDGKVTLDEFHEYYKNVSASVDDDDYFELMIRNAWHIPGGEGWCANTSNTRVLVTFTDGRQQVVCIENDLGLDLHNDAAVRKRLASQGVKNIAKIELSG
jgi:Ca2+-binding EF-hand superfamily protein